MGGHTLHIGDGQGTYFQIKHASAHSVGKSWKRTQKTYIEAQCTKHTHIQRHTHAHRDITRTLRFMNNLTNLMIVNDMALLKC